MSHHRILNPPLWFVLVVSLTAQPALSQPADDEGWIRLFNGKDLTGWKVPPGDNGHWKVVDGAIDYDALSESNQQKHLWTEAEFGDFVLRLQWRFKQAAGMMPMPIILPDGSLKTDEHGEVIYQIGPNADSGILLRGGPQVNLWCWPVGSGELWSVRNNRSLPAETRAAAVPRVHADRPIGQWNDMEITLRGDRVTVVLNGKTVIENAQIPGIPAKGPIGFQHHGGPLRERQREQLKARGAPVPAGPNAMHPTSSLVQFRNVYIKPLPPSNSQSSSNPPGSIQDLLKDGLQHWQTSPTAGWRWKDGIVRLEGRTDGKMRNEDYLWTKEQYGDFILELEAQVPDGYCNSGIFLRTADKNDPVQTGLEIQVTNCFGKPVTRGGTAGAIYDCLAPSENAMGRPGQWNRFRITCRGPKIEVELNGRQITDANLDQWTVAGQNPDGSPNKFTRPLCEFARTGYIGLQDHGRPVAYRHIRIQRLD